MKKILLIAMLFVATYATQAQGNGSPVPTPGTHVNADDITYTITTAPQGNGNNTVLRIEGYFVGLGSSAKVTVPATVNTYSVDATLVVDRNCGPNPGGNVPPGLSKEKTKAIGVGTTTISRNGRMPWSAEVRGGGYLCPPPFVAANYSFSLEIGLQDGGFMVNDKSVPLK